jgi:hypothetical protein
MHHLTPTTLYSLRKDLLSTEQTSQLILIPPKTKLHGLSPRANYTDRAAAAGRRS